MVREWIRVRVGGEEGGRGGGGEEERDCLSETWEQNSMTLEHRA